MQLVVSISRTLGKHSLERTQVRCHPILSHVEPPDRALVEVPRGGVKGAIEGVWKLLQHPAVRLADALPHVDDVESRTRADLERDLRSVDRHARSSRAGSDAANGQPWPGGLRLKQK